MEPYLNLPLRLFPIYNHQENFLAGHKHVSFKMEYLLSYFELFFPPSLLTFIHLSHSLRSQNINCINTLKIKTDPIWNEVIVVEFILRSYYDLNNSCTFYNVLQIQVWPGFNLLTSLK